MNRGNLEQPIRLTGSIVGFSNGLGSNEVISVNGKKGVVVLTAADVGARSSSWTPSWSDVSNKPTFATVATTGSYNDLTNKPTIPTKTSQLQNDSGFLDAVLDTDVKLSSELKTYYNIGRITNASATNPVSIGNQGDSIRQVLNNLTQMEENQPYILSSPTLTNLSFSVTGFDELGSEINTINYTLSTYQGQYSYQPNPTGVTWSKYTFSGGCAQVDKTTTSGTLTLSNTYIVGTSQPVSFTCIGTHGAGGIAKTNLGNNSNPIVQIEAGTKQITNTFSKTVVTYPYYTSSSTVTTPTTGTRGQLKLESTSGQNINYQAQKYLWIFSVNNNPNKKIQIYSEVAKEWGDAMGGTEPPVQVTFTMSNNKTRTYYAYRTTKVSQSDGSALIRLN